MTLEKNPNNIVEYSVAFRKFCGCDFLERPHSAVLANLS